MISNSELGSGIAAKINRPTIHLRWVRHQIKERTLLLRCSPHCSHQADCQSIHVPQALNILPPCPVFKPAHQYLAPIPLFVPTCEDLWCEVIQMIHQHRSRPAQSQIDCSFGLPWLPRTEYFGEEQLPHYPIRPRSKVELKPPPCRLIQGNLLWSHVSSFSL